MNLPARAPMSPVEEFVGKVLDPDRMDDLRRSLPSHIKPELFQRNLLNAVMINPELMDYAPGLLFREVSKAASLGLFLDPQLGEAYIVIAYNYKTRSKEPQLRIGYRGMIKLARQSGEVSKTYAREVRAQDKIRCLQGTTEELVHEPALFTDRGDVVGYYAVIKYRADEFDFEPMDVGQIRGVRDRSDGWKAFSDSKIKSTPWASDEDEMAKKTVLRRLLKRAPQSPELAEAIRIEDAAEHSEMVRIAPLRPPKPPAPQQIAQQSPIVVDVLEASDPARETARPAVKEVAARPKPPVPPKPPASTQRQVANDSADPTRLFLRIDTALAAIDDPHELGEAFERACPAEMFRDLMPPDQDTARNILSKHEERLGS